MYMRILVHNARQGSSTILPRPSLIYNPSEVDDFRYFSSAVSSKQLPFPNVHPRPFRFFPTFSTRSTRISTNRARTSIGPAAAMKPDISSVEHSENVGNENQRDSTYNDQNLTLMR